MAAWIFPLKRDRKDRAAALNEPGKGKPVEERQVLREESHVTPAPNLLISHASKSGRSLAW